MGARNLGGWRSMDIVQLCACVGFPYIGGIIGSSMIVKNLEWYKNLKKPKFTPPPWFFGPAWGILYGCMGLASFILLQEAKPGANITLPLVLYSTHLLLNWSWPYVFFGLRKLKISVGVIIATTICATQSAILFSGISTAAGCMMIPYVLYLIFASYLNIGTAILNQRSPKSI
ncbi:Translocator protein [Echinococcus granulosus]|uniref:Translocator protein n=1 Tax=Echinococcus granulosus TaxID=6210 RepID=A0A068WQG0_ECHGR|nr:Translocator protein [Echinococcus granulosus]CDS20733.1 translocator protein [Echinococcus granulosus]